MKTDSVTRYSRVEIGDAANHGRHARFDYTGGYIGISDMNDKGFDGDRVLLTPKQFRALVKFVTAKGKQR